MGYLLPLLELFETNNIIWDDLLDSDIYWLWLDRLRYPGREMIIYILKTSHEHPFYRANRSMNQKMIWGEEIGIAAVAKSTTATVRCQSTGQRILVYRWQIFKERGRPVEQKHSPPPFLLSPLTWENPRGLILILVLISIPPRLWCDIYGGKI